jgi:hypothetical protein
VITHSVVSESLGSSVIRPAADVDDDTTMIRSYGSS